MDDLQHKLLSQCVEEDGPIEGSPCLVWQGTKDGKGYGIITVPEEYRDIYGHRWANSKQTTTIVGTHRLSYEMFVGPIPDGLWVLHRCDVEACIRPEHLWLGTQQDNIDDMNAKGRRASTVGENNPKALLSNKDVAWIKFYLWQGKYSKQDIADKYGVGRWVIWRIAIGVSWKHVEMADPEDMPMDPFWPKLPPGPPLDDRRF